MVLTRSRKAIFLVLAAASLFISAPTALILGIVFSLLLDNPWRKQTSRWSKRLLQASVIGLGFGVSIGQVWNTGKSALVYTVVGISLTMIVGRLLGKYFRINDNVSALISFGTAICGGSAIAAMAPVIDSNDDETAVSLATVFALNSAALILFPYIGHLLNMTQRQFGLWSALAIHDTSSVVGAAAVYGSSALAVATTVKLTRAVWIAPVAAATAWVKKSRGGAKVPLFIFGFIGAALVNTLLPQFSQTWHGVTAVARQSLVVTLFLVGAGLTRDVLRNVGAKPLVVGMLLWLLVSSATLAAIMNGIIR